MTFDNFSDASFSTNEYVPSEQFFGYLVFTSSFYFLSDGGGQANQNFTFRTAFFKDGLEVGTISTTANNYTSGVHKKFILSTAYGSGSILSPLSTYSVKCYVTMNSGTDTYYVTNTNSPYVFATNTFSVVRNRTYVYGSAILLNSLYDVLFSSIFRDLCNMYCLVIQTNEITKEVRLSKLNEIFDNISYSENWSSKIDLSKKISVKYNVGNYAQKNHLKYNEGLKYNGFLTVSNVNLTPEKTIVTTFVKEPDGGKNIFDSLEVPIIHGKESKFEPAIKMVNRFLLMDKKTTPTSFDWFYSTEELGGVDPDTYVSTTVNGLGLCYFKKSSETDSLDFPSLITANYGTLQGMLDKTKVVSAYFRLTEIDVVNIDFTIPIYLDINTGTTSINGYFYINKISNFKVDSSTLVELIRL